MRIRILYALMAAYVVATAIHIGYVMAHEPFAFDAWNVAVDTHSQPFSFGRWLDYWWFEYTHSNPRIGQSFAYLSYKLEYFAVLATPLAYLAISLAVTTLGLGRWPRRGRELALWAIAIGFGWFAFPSIGRNMFNRAYGANYVYTLAIQLWFLVPLRLASTYDVGRGRAIAYGLAGMVAGVCNEHTAPALLAFLVLYAWTVRRESLGLRIPIDGDDSVGAPPYDRSSARLVWAGAIGFAIGFAAIFFAPGQSERYGGLATKTSLPMRLVQRGVIGAIDIVGDYLQYAAPLLVVIALSIILIRKRDRETRTPDGEARDNDAIGLAVLAFVLGIVLAMTLWVSPKLGGRFYLMSMALLLAATLGLIDVAFERPRQLVPFVLIAVFASSFAAARTIPLYRRTFAESEARLAGLAATPPGGVFVADAFDQGGESWWYIGDDFDDPLKRERVATYMGLARVVFRGFDLDAPLGAAGVRVVGRYQIAGEPCPTEDGELDLAGKRLDVSGVVATTRAEVARLRASSSRDIASYELAVEFPGKPPALPRPRIVVARDVGGRFEAHPGAIVRPGASLAREVRVDGLPPGLELHVWQLGGEVRKLDADRRFSPWRTGLYWALACDTRECWVVAAARAHAG